MFLLLGASAKRTETDVEYWKKWTAFKQRGDRYLPNYLTGAEHSDRFTIFMDNIDRINEHNAKGLSWRMGVTPFADMTAEEFGEKVIGDTCKSEFAQQSKINHAKTKLFMGRRLEEGEMRATSDSVDWTAAGKVTGVKDQGSCGSCWAFSTTGCIEARTAIHNNADPVSLSEQELVDCDTQSAGCNGGSMQTGFAYAMDNSGLCLETDYAYKAKTGKRCKASSCSHHSPVASYDNVNVGESYLEAAVNDGPVSVAIEADQMAFQLYTDGVFSGDCGTGLDHGVLAVGYGSDPSYGAYWKVKNSWGSGWGENGYIRMCKDCDKNGANGQCGIAEAATYAIISG